MFVARGCACNWADLFSDNGGAIQQKTGAFLVHMRLFGELGRARTRKCLKRIDFERLDCH